MQAAETNEGLIHLTDGVDWISECFPIDDLHEHVSLYIIRFDGRNLVIDSGSFYHRESIEARLTAATRGRGIDVLILSHSDYPHSGNIGAFRRKWGDFEIVASCGDPEVQGLPYATRSKIGGSMEIRGRTFSFIDPPLADRSHTSWIFDHASRVLFAADGFGCYHHPGECGWTSREFTVGIPAAGIFAFHRDNIGWLRYTDPDRFRGKLEGMLDRLDPSFVAPIHGNPIAAADLPEYVDRLVDATRQVSEAYQIA